MSAPEQQGQTTYSSYARSLLAITPQWPEFEDLYDILTTPLPPGESPYMSLFDFTKVTCDTRNFNESANGWREAVDNIAEEVKTRLIVLNFRKTHVSRKMLDYIGSKYAVEPIFLTRHFDVVKEEEKSELVRHDEPVNMLSMPLSMQKSFHVGYYPTLHTSYKVLDQPRAKICLILFTTILGSQGGHALSLEFERTHVRSLQQHQFTELVRFDVQYQKDLRGSNRQMCLHMTYNPLEGMLPMLEMIVSERHRSIRQDIQELMNDIAAAERKELEGYQFRGNFWNYELRFHKSNLSRTFANLKALRSEESKQHWIEKLDSYMKDIQNVIDALDDARAEFEIFRNVGIFERVIAHSRESVRAADSVGRVTLLAFYFVVIICSLIVY